MIYSGDFHLAACILENIPDYVNKLLFACQKDYEKNILSKLIGFN
jgi:hypothetical protein